MSAIACIDRQAARAAAAALFWRRVLALDSLRPTGLDARALSPVLAGFLAQHARHSAAYMALSPMPLIGCSR